MVGYLWQNTQVNLVLELDVLDNVQMPLLGAGWSARDRTQRTHYLVEALGLSHRARNHPAELSAGEQQRLGLAVALANHPRLLLADEPTSQLDNAAARGVLEDLRRLQAELGTTVIMVTHDHQVEEYVERVVLIRDCRTSTETRFAGAPGERMAEELVIVDAAPAFSFRRSTSRRWACGEGPVCGWRMGGSSSSRCLSTRMRVRPVADAVVMEAVAKPFRSGGSVSALCTRCTCQWPRVSSLRCAAARARGRPRC